MSKCCPLGGSVSVPRPRTDTESSAKSDNASGFNIDEYREFGEHEDQYGTALHCAVYHNQVFDLYIDIFSKA